MKKHLILITLIFITVSAKSQEYFHLVIGDTVNISREAMSAGTMTDRLRKDAADYAQYAPIPRMAEMDYVFGADINEYKKLGGYGVLYIPSMNRDSTEYPIKRVYLKQGNVITELQKIGELNITVTDPGIIATFGRHRVDYYYLIPYALTHVYSELMIDWSANRHGFVLAKFPSEQAVNYKTEGAGKNHGIDKNFLKDFLKREYNVSSN